MSDESESTINFNCTGLWVFGYLIFVWLTPAQLDLNIFLPVLGIVAGIEIIEAILRIIYNVVKK